MKYCVRPRIVEAYQWTGDLKAETPKWLDRAMEFAYLDKYIAIAKAPYRWTLSIITIHGRSTISPGDWIVLWDDDRLAAYRPKLFEEIYRPEEEMKQ